MSFFKKLFSRKQYTLENFPPIREEIKKGNYVFVNLYSESCLVCKRTKPMIEEVHQQYPNVNILEILIDEFPEKQLRKYGIVFTPTLALFGKKGEALHRSVGLIQKEKLVELFSLSK
ncbi:MAG: thioredoxin family protein [Asgard group archaeon]|nr:thioredoxin family protein [Asgard group archaeon]